MSREDQSFRSDLPLRKFSLNAVPQGRTLVSLVLASVLALAGCAGGDDSGAATGLGGSAHIVKWMEELAPGLENQKLNEIVLPGTHDSGTYNITESSELANDGNTNPCALPIIKRIINAFDSIPIFTGAFPSCGQTQAGWSKTQTRNIRQQLDDGIRYIDLRVWQSEGQYKVVHSLVSVDIDEVLKDVKSFYSVPGYESKEIVILDINHTYQMTAEADQILVQKIKTALTTDSGKSLLIPRCSNADCTEATDLTLGKLWNKPDQRVIVFYRHSGSDKVMRDNPELWSNTNDGTAMILSPYFNTNASSQLTAAMRQSAWNDDAVASFRAKGGFTVTQAIRTIDTAGVDVHNGLTTALWNKYGEMKCFDDFNIWVLGEKVTLKEGFCLSNQSIWDNQDWCKYCATNLLAYGEETNWENEKSNWADEIFAPTSNIVIVDNYSANTRWKYKDSFAGYVDTVRKMNQARYCDRWHVSYPVAGDFKFTKAANLAMGQIDHNGRPDLVAFHIGADGGDYRIGWNVNGMGHPVAWSAPIAIPGSWQETTAGAIAIGDIDGNGRPELVVFSITPGGFLNRNTGHYRIGWNLNESGAPASWSTLFEMAGGLWGSDVTGGGIAMGDLDGNGRPDLLAFNVERSDSWHHAGYYRIGWNVDARGIPASWSAPLKVADWSEGQVHGVAVALGDLNGDGRPELIAFHVGDVAGGKKDGSYQIGVMDNSKTGSPVSWGAPIVMGGQWGQNPLGGGMAVGDLNGDGRPDLAVFQIDSKSLGFTNSTTGYYQFALDVTSTGAVPPSRCTQ